MTGLPASRAVTRLGWAAYVLALLVVVADQLSKAWVLYGLQDWASKAFVLTGAHLDQRDVLKILPVLSVSMVWNRGFSFGLLSGTGLARWGLFAFSLVVAAGLAVWARRVIKPLPALALGLIMGGAVGNALDRVRLGAVVDFIDVSGLGFFPLGVQRGRQRHHRRRRPAAARLAARPAGALSPASPRAFASRRALMYPARHRPGRLRSEA